MKAIRLWTPLRPFNFLSDVVCRGSLPQQQYHQPNSKLHKNEIWLSYHLKASRFFEKIARRLHCLKITEKGLIVPNIKRAHWGKNPLFIQKFPWFWYFKNVNFMKNDISKMRFLWKMRIQNVNFAKNEISKMWTLRKIRF